MTNPPSPPFTSHPVHPTSPGNLVVSLNVSANELEALRAALWYATSPTQTPKWSMSVKMSRAAEDAFSKIVSLLDKWERGKVKSVEDTGTAQRPTDTQGGRVPNHAGEDDARTVRSGVGAT